MQTRTMAHPTPKFDKRVAVLSYRLRTLAHVQEHDALEVATKLASTTISSVKDAIVSHNRFPHCFSSRALIELWSQSVDIRELYHQMKVAANEKKFANQQKQKPSLQAGPVLSPIPTKSRHFQKSQPETVPRAPSQGPSHFVSSTGDVGQSVSRSCTPSYTPSIKINSIASPSIRAISGSSHRIPLTSPLTKKVSRIPPAMVSRQQRQTQQVQSVLPKMANESDWEYMIRLDSELFHVEQEHAVLTKHLHKQEYFQELKNQIAKSKPKAAAFNQSEEAQFKLQAQQAAKAYAAEQKRMEEARKVKAKEMKKEMNDVLNGAEAKRKQVELQRLHDRDFMSRKAKVAALEETMDFKIKAAKQQKMKEETMQANASAIQAKKLALERERANERKLLAELEMAAAAREHIRLSNVRRRKEEIEEKLSMMPSVFKKQDEAAKLAAARAEAEAANHERNLQLREQIAAQKLAESERKRFETVQLQIMGNKQKRRQERKQEEAMLEEAFASDQAVEAARERKRLEYKANQRRQLKILQAQEQEKLMAADAFEFIDPAIARGNERIIETKLRQLAAAQARFQAMQKAAELRPRMMKMASKEQDKWQGAANQQSGLDPAHQGVIDRIEHRISRFASPHK